MICLKLEYTFCDLKKDISPGGDNLSLLPTQDAVHDILTKPLLLFFSMTFLRSLLDANILL